MTSSNHGRPGKCSEAPTMSSEEQRALEAHRRNSAEVLIAIPTKWLLQCGEACRCKGFEEESSISSESPDKPTTLGKAIAAHSDLVCTLESGR